MVYTSLVVIGLRSWKVGIDTYRAVVKLLCCSMLVSYNIIWSDRVTCIGYTSSGSTLSHAAVSTVDDISEPHVCASCSFTDDSTARGCTVELQNDEFTFVFNMSRQSSEELTLLECFLVPEAGVFSVSVKEIQHDSLVGNNVLRLPDVSVGSNTDRNTQSVGIGTYD